jgi:hypothetical protein
MAAILAIGAGPVALTSDNGAHLTIPLSALTFENGAIKISGWPPYDHAPNDPDGTAFKQLVTDWLGYLVGQQLLKPDTSGAAAPAGPAFLVEAQHAGANGNDIALAISNVNPQVPPSTTTFDLTVDVTDTYKDLTLATIADIIGTSVDGGSKPGLVFLDTSVAPSGKMPAAATVSLTGSPLRAQFADANNQPAVTLGAPGDGGGGTFSAQITVTAADKFDLKVTWSKTLANKTIADHTVAFQYVVKLSKPLGDYGVPKAETITLSGGADPTTATVPPTAATASADPA